MNENHCVSAYASFGFDANMMDTYPALTSGSTLCIVPEEMRLDIEGMNAYFEKNGVTHAFMTTQVGRQFEKTAEVFIKNPFDSGEYERAYRTGDIVRWREDGNIEFIGRRDGQVKIRGFRIELSEVEAVIREFPKVQDATVSAFDHPAGGKFIAAYVVGAEKISIDELNKFIAERKPPYAQCRRVN